MNAALVQQLLPDHPEDDGTIRWLFDHVERLRELYQPQPMWLTAIVARHVLSAVMTAGGSRA